MEVAYAKCQSYITGKCSRSLRILVRKGFVVEMRFVSIFAEWSKSVGSIVESVSNEGNDINK